MAWWEKGLDILQRTNFAAAGFAKALVQGRNPYRAALAGLTGQERNTFSDALKAAGMDAGMARSALGFALDIVGDPLTYASFGVGAGVKGTVGAVAKTLTKTGAAAREANLLAKTAQAGRILARPTMEEALE